MISNYETFDLIRIYQDLEANYQEKSPRFLAASLCEYSYNGNLYSLPFQYFFTSYNIEITFCADADAIALESFSGNALPKHHSKKSY